MNLVKVRPTSPTTGPRQRGPAPSAVGLRDAVPPRLAPVPDSDERVASSTTPQTLVRLRDVRRRFGEHVVLDGIDLEIGAGEFVSVLGRSGTGKSTLLRALDGFDREVTGYIEVPARRVVVYQDARLLPWARVIDNVIIGLKGHQARARGREVLDEVSLASHERAWPVTLSGGEAQRVALARALLREPDLLLLDEPFGALDALTRIAMHALLRALCQRHHPSVLLVTHDVNEAIALSDRIVVLDQGKVVHDEPVGLPEPRTLHSAGFAILRDRLHRQLGVDATPARPPWSEHPSATASSDGAVAQAEVPQP